jgi:hypothetical protein
MGHILTPLHARSRAFRLRLLGTPSSDLLARIKTYHAPNSPLRFAPEGATTSAGREMSHIFSLVVEPLGSDS